MKIRWLLALFFCGLILSVYWRRRVPSISQNTVAATDPPPAYLRSLRPSYPYSVIPGGAYSPQELRNAGDKDSVVRAHYADFNWKDARMVQLTADRYEYVSYRSQNQIRWTAKKLRIPKGEYLLTDGVHFARARCGNRLSDEPQQEISSVEPPPELLAQPLPQLNNLSQLDLSQAPAAVVEDVPVDSSPRLAAFLPPDSSSTVFVQPSPELQAGIPSAPLEAAAPAYFPPPPPILRNTPKPPDDDSPNPPARPPASPSPVPEPASVYLFLLTFVVVLWSSTRVMAAEDKPDTD